MTQPVFDDASGLWTLPGLKETTMPHALRHVTERIEFGIKRAKHTAVIQAGGNIGLWPRRYAQVFAQVLTFEPEPLTFECLTRNTSQIANVQRFCAALGDKESIARISRRSLGSHNIDELDRDASPCRITTIDDQAGRVPHIGLIQLDVEGYEYPALLGARLTISRCKPVIQLEMNETVARFPWTHADVYATLKAWGYRRTYKIKSDEVFEHA